MAKYDEPFNLKDGFHLATNIADLIDDETLNTLGSQLKTSITTDIQSRKEWLDKNDKWMELVTQVIEAKTYPWPNASNVKFPLVSTAAVQFHARAFPALLGTAKPIKARVIGRDDTSVKANRAGRVSTYMSWQILEDMDGWVDDMDRLLFLVPIIGSLYKKTYYSETKKKNVSELIHPRDFIINYDAIEIGDARKSCRLWKTPNKIISMQNRGLYRDIPEDEGESRAVISKQKSETADKIHGITSPGIEDDYAQLELFEVHCMWDLDDDGYMEPYICTIREKDGKIYRIVANYTDDDIEIDDKKVLEIHAKEYFTHYFFLPDPESKTHGIGFGTMIGPINEAVNTIINQLTDSGHMSTLGGGFLSRGLRIKGGALRFKPNEWKTINATGDDLRKSIFPMPTKEPSATLFQLLGLMIDSGKDLSSVQDQMVGRNPGQNQPNSTTQSVLEQGLKVFNGIYKRLYRSMTSEFKKLYKLNQEHPDPVKYMNVLDLAGGEIQSAVDDPQIGMEGVLKFLRDDFKAEDIDIIPTAEPDMVAEAQKIQRAGALLGKMGAGIPLNSKEVLKRVLEAEGHEDIPVLMDTSEEKPPAEFQLKTAEFEHRKQVEGLELKLKAIKTDAEVLNLNMDAELKMAQAENESIEGLHAQFMAQKKHIQEEYDSVTKRLKVIMDGALGMADGQTRNVERADKQRALR